MRKKQKLRTATAVILTVAMAVGALTGCGGNSKKESGSDGEAYSAENPAHITYKSLAWMLAEQDETQAVINEWNEAHPEIQVEYIQGRLGDCGSGDADSFETGDVPDIFQYWTPPIQLWKERGFLTDLTPMLDDEMKNDVNQEVWDLMTHRTGKLLRFRIRAKLI